MEKRGISDLVVTMLVVILVLAAVVIVWNLVATEIIEGGEVAGAKSQFLIEKLQIKNFAGDPQNPDTINLTIQRGPGRQQLLNVSIVQPQADIVFIIESSGLMAPRIEEVEATIQNFINEIGSADINYRLALIDFRDYPQTICGNMNPAESFPNRTHIFSDGSFTENVQEFRNALNVLGATPFTGSLDTPQSHLTAVNSTFDLPWRPTAKKFILLFAPTIHHALDCEYLGWSDYYLVSPEGINSSVPDDGCYQGPLYTVEVAERLVDRGIIYHYVNRNQPSQGPGDEREGVCKNRIMADTMTSITGGRFYPFESEGDIEAILADLAEQIVREFRSITQFDYLVIAVYGETEVQVFQIFNPPTQPLEARIYQIPPEGEELTIEEIRKIEIYPVIVTPSGQTVVSDSPMDVWEV